MWYEFSIHVNFQQQRQFIRELKEWIHGLEERKLVQGFAFNHYFGVSIDDELRIRFDYLHEQDLNTVRDELREKLIGFGHSGRFRENPWDGQEHVLRAYEFGSRCTFLYWELIEKGRVSEDYVSNFLEVSGQQARIHNTSFQFQHNFNHGIMNSLGIPKQPNEQLIHLFALMESTNSEDIKELCDKIQRHPLMSQMQTVRK